MIPAAFGRVFENEFQFRMPKRIDFLRDMVDNVSVWRIAADTCRRRQRKGKKGKDGRKDDKDRCGFRLSGSRKDDAD